jgi:hypothetical protein
MKTKHLGITGMTFFGVFFFAISQAACVVPSGQTASGNSASSLNRGTAKRGLFGLSDSQGAPADASSSTSALPSFPSLGAPLTTRSAHARDTNSPRSLPSTGGLVKVEGNSWRTGLPATRVFALLGRSLSQAYILTRVDRRNLSLQTDWDKFFIDGRLFRNRFVVSVFPIGPRQTEVLIRNNLEYFSGAAGQSGSQADGDWLPSPDVTDEVAKLVDGVNLQIQNAALTRARR